MHGLAWMDSIPDVDGISENWVRVQYPTDDEPIDPRDSARADHEAQEVYDFADGLVSTWNPVMDENGIGELPQTQVHPCHKRYRDVEDEDRDYAELIAILWNVILDVPLLTVFVVKREKTRTPICRPPKISLLVHSP